MTVTRRSPGGRTLRTVGGLSCEHPNNGGSHDTDRISVFNFDNETGLLHFTGNEYDVPSPNFVCVAARRHHVLGK